MDQLSTTTVDLDRSVDNARDEAIKRIETIMRQAAVAMLATRSHGEKNSRVEIEIGVSNGTARLIWSASISDTGAAPYVSSGLYHSSGSGALTAADLAALVVHATEHTRRLVATHETILAARRASTESQIAGYSAIASVDGHEGGSSR